MNISSKHLLVGDQVSQMECSKNKLKFESGLPDTIVIHYTAGRSAESSARELCNPVVKASAHLVIGREGEIYQLVPFDTITWHAGESFYGGRSGLNKYSIGIEIDNAGQLEKVGSEYKAWFGKKYQENEVLYAAHRNNSTKSYWHLYTEKQIEACRQVCVELMKQYKITTIVGHEEIAPKERLIRALLFHLINSGITCFRKTVQMSRMKSIRRVLCLPISLIYAMVQELILRRLPSPFVREANLLYWRKWMAGTKLKQKLLVG
ncbi:MAG: N-acetylmuramoyl-L-alanine amidase [Bacteroidales bacterium]